MYCLRTILIVISTFSGGLYLSAYISEDLQFEGQCVRYFLIAHTPFVVVRVRVSINIAQEWIAIRVIAVRKLQEHSIEVRNSRRPLGRLTLTLTVTVRES